MAASSEVERRIQFYVADIGLGADLKPLVFDARKALGELKAIDPSTGELYQLRSSIELCAFDPEPKYARMKFGKIRRHEHPPVETQGEATLRPIGLSVLDGLVELVHVVFFPKNVIGVEYNHYGPRARALGPYLAAKAPSVEGLSVDALLLRDAWDLLKTAKSITTLTVHVDSYYLGPESEASQELKDLLGGIAGDTSAGRIDITLRPAAHRKGKLKKIQKLLKSMFSKEELSDALHKLSATGVDGDGKKIEEMDFLGDWVATRKKVLRLSPETRSVDPESAYNAIIEAYEELSDKLDTALRMRMKD